MNIIGEIFKYSFDCKEWNFWFEEYFHIKFCDIFLIAKQCDRFLVVKQPPRLNSEKLVYHIIDNQIIWKDNIPIKIRNYINRIFSLRTFS